MVKEMLGSPCYMVFDLEVPLGNTYLETTKQAN